MKIIKIILQFIIIFCIVSIVNSYLSTKIQENVIFSEKLIDTSSIIIRLVITFILMVNLIPAIRRKFDKTKNI